MREAVSVLLITSHSDPANSSPKITMNKLKLPVAYQVTSWEKSCLQKYTKGPKEQQTFQNH